MKPSKYSLSIEAKAQKALAKLDRATQLRIIAALKLLTSNPRPSKAKQIVGVENLWRIRVGDYRIIYQIEDSRLIILVLRIGHRRDVYRNIN